MATGFSPGTSNFPCQYHFTNAPYSSSPTCCSPHKYKRVKPGNLPKTMLFGKSRRVGGGALDRKVRSLFFVFKSFSCVAEYGGEHSVSSHDFLSDLIPPYSPLNCTGINSDQLQQTFVTGGYERQDPRCVKFRSYGKSVIRGTRSTRSQKLITDKHEHIRDSVYWNGVGVHG